MAARLVTAPSASLPPAISFSQTRLDSAPEPPVHTYERLSSVHERHAPPTRQSASLTFALLSQFCARLHARLARLHLNQPRLCSATSRLCLFVHPRLPPPLSTRLAAQTLLIENSQLREKQWYHLALTQSPPPTFGSSTLTLYINGQATHSSSTLRYPSGNKPLDRCFIGTDGGGTELAAEGRLQSVSVQCSS